MIARFLVGGVDELDRIGWVGREEEERKLDVAEETCSVYHVKIMMKRIYPHTLGAVGYILIVVVGYKVRLLQPQP